MTKTLLGVALAGTLLMATATAYGQQRSPETTVSARETLVAPSLTVGAARHSRSTPPLFTFGGVEVRAWAPVQPHYSAQANRNLAALPIWNAG
jgi:hypothetical protein